MLRRKKIVRHAPPGRGTQNWVWTSHVRSVLQERGALCKVRRRRRYAESAAPAGIAWLGLRSRPIAAMALGAWQTRRARTRAQSVRHAATVRKGALRPRNATQGATVGLGVRGTCCAPRGLGVAPETLQRKRNARHATQGRGALSSARRVRRSAGRATQGRGAQLSGQRRRLPARCALSGPTAGRALHRRPTVTASTARRARRTSPL